MMAPTMWVVALLLEGASGFSLAPLTGIRCEHTSNQRARKNTHTCTRRAAQALTMGREQDRTAPADRQSTGAEVNSRGERSAGAAGDCRASGARCGGGQGAMG